MVKSTDHITDIESVYLSKIEYEESQPQGNQSFNSIVVERSIRTENSSIESDISHSLGSVLVIFLIISFLFGLTLTLNDWLKSTKNFLAKNRLMCSSKKENTLSSTGFDEWHQAWRANLTQREKLERKKKAKNKFFEISITSLIILGMLGLTYVAWIFLGEVGAVITFWLSVFWWISVNKHHSKF